MLALHSSGLVARLFLVEISRLAVFRVDDGEVEGKPWREVAVSTALDILRDPRRGVDFGNEVRVAFPDPAAVRLT